MPSVLLLIFAPLRLRSLIFSPKKVRSSRFQKFKLVRGSRSPPFIRLLTRDPQLVCFIFSLIELTLVVLWATRPHVRSYSPSVAAAVLSFAASLLICLISPLEHSRSIRPSIFLNAYLLLSFVFDAVVLRTLLLSSFDNVIRAVFTTSLAVKAVVLFQEAHEKRSYLTPADRQYGPEATSGLYSLGTFWWLNSLIRRGFQQVLKSDDLYPIDGDMVAETVNAKFWTMWNACMSLRSVDFVTPY